jgi:hypothetical protein
MIKIPFVSDSIFFWNPTKDYRDQPLHFLMGSLPVLLVGWFYSETGMWIMSALDVLVFCAVREYRQHTVSKNFIDLDLLFCILGIVVGCLIVAFVIH